MPPKKQSKKAPKTPPLPEKCAICDNVPPTKRVPTKGHGDLAVCDNCARWAKEKGYLR